MEQLEVVLHQLAKDRARANAVQRAYEEIEWVDALSRGEASRAYEKRGQRKDRLFRLGRFVEVAVERRSHRLLEQLFLRAEGAVDERDVDADIARDVAQRRVVVGMLREAHRRRGEDAVARGIGRSS